MRRKNIRPEATEGARAIGNCVRTLLERHGVVRDRQSQAVADVLQFSATHGLRKLTGESALTAVEMAQIALRYGESMGRLLMPLMLSDPDPALMADLQRALLPRLLDAGGKDMAAELHGQLVAHTFDEAVLLVDGASVPCHVILGSPASPASGCAFVAIGGAGKWVVLPRERVTTPGREVLKLVVGADTPGGA